MDEVTCPHCGAIFSPDNTGGMCPNCSRSTGALRAKLRLVGGYIPITAFLVVWALLTHDVIFVVGGVLLLWSAFAQKMDIGLHRPLTALNVNTNEHANIGMPTSRPSMPAGWQTLAARPRDVYMPLATKLMFVLALSGYLAASGLLVADTWKKLPAFAKDPQTAWFHVLWLAMWIWISVAILRGRFDRGILRDGELTPGILTDWQTRRHGTRISYEFWTDAGLRFEGHGTVASKDELADKEAPLKIFYLPHEPSKNVALCCTSFRIRVL